MFDASGPRSYIYHGRWLIFHMNVSLAHHVYEITQGRGRENLMTDPSTWLAICQSNEDCESPACSRQNRFFSWWFGENHTWWLENTSRSMKLHLEVRKYKVNESTAVGQKIKGQWKYSCRSENKRSMKVQLKARINNVTESTPDGQKI